MKNALVKTDFKFPGQKSVYHGKVRDVYNIDDELLVMVVSDRISAFDVILPEGIPYKGQVLNQIAAKFLDATSDIVPNWKVATPDPMVTVGLRCEPFKVEMVVRGYLTGHAWREYKAGKRTLCGETMPEGMKENEKFPHPIITPTTKADEGHDEDISKAEIIARGIVSKEDYEQLEKYTLALYHEIHTPDSSRYFYAEGYEDRLARGEEQRQLSKEFVRQWLIQNGFQGKEGQQVPEMTEEYCNSVSDRYIELYEHIVGEKFVKAEGEDVAARIEKHVTDFLNNRKK